MSRYSRFPFAISFAALFCSLFFASNTVFAIPSVERFKPIDIPIPHPQQGIKNVWDDVQISGIMKAPDGTAYTVGGFYHSKDLWMVRFAPDQVGMWKYQLTFSDMFTKREIIDSFQCISSNEQGFIRLHPANPKRWIYSATGNLYAPVGFGDCMGAARDSILADADLLDGGYRPKGYHEGIAWILPYSQYLISYGDVAGFNIYRYSDGNCAYSIFKNISASGNNYDTLHSRWTDTLFTALRAHGFRIFMTIMTGPQGNSSDNNSMAATLRYVQYCIDRYGSLVDFWELTNESNPDSLWVAKAANYFHANDTYHHLVSMSNQMPNHPSIDIISPHWYGREDVRNSDANTAFNITYEYGLIRKPIIFGEQGEGGWDSLSAIRLRGRIWSALFNEGTLIFWNSTFAKDCPCNQYLGWEERRYARVLQNFSVLLDSGMRPVPERQSGDLNIWGLESQRAFAIYIRNSQDVKKLNSGRKITLTAKGPGGTGVWYDVHSGNVLGLAPLDPGQNTITIPDFQTDIAFISEGTPAVDKSFRIDIDPRTEELLNIPLNTPQTFSLRITNTGVNNIVLEKNWVSSPSKILSLSVATPFPLTLSGGESITIPVQYTMTDTGGTAVMLSFLQSASPSWENVAISATGAPRSGVAESKKEEELIQVFPDPANDLLTVRTLSPYKGPLTINIFSIDGMKIAEKTTGDSNESLIDVSKFPDGSYTVSLSSQGTILGSKKVIIMH